MMLSDEVSQSLKALFLHVFGVECYYSKVVLVFPHVVRFA